MIRTVFCLLLLSLLCACSLKTDTSLHSTNVSASAASLQYTDFEISYRRKLTYFFKKYIDNKREKSIEQLVFLDQEIRDLLIPINAYYKNTAPTNDCKLYHLPKISNQLGISDNHYGCQLIYSGQLLADAHQMNPHSPWRQYTLFSTCDDYDSEVLSWMPHLKEYDQYLKEFPDGPFAGDVLASKAYFYSDVALVAYYRAFHNMSRGDYKYDCFETYITSASLQDQFAQAQKQALYYLGQSLKFTRKPETLTERENAFLEIQSRIFSPRLLSYGWHWCQD